MTTTYFGTKADRINYLQNQFRIRRLTTSESQELLALEDESRQEARQATPQQQTEADQLVSKLQELRDVQAQRKRVAAEAFANTVMHQWRTTQPKLEAATVKATAEVDAWMKQKLAFDSIANRKLLVEHMVQHNQTVEDSARVLGGSLTFDADIAAREQAKRDEEQKRELCLFIAQHFSPQLSDQDMEFNRWIKQPLEVVRQKAAMVKHNKELIARMKANPTLKPAQLAQQDRTQDVQADADRRAEYVLHQQQGHYAPLPEYIKSGERIDSAFLFILSNTNYPEFKQWVKKFGAGALTARIRGLA